jgi:hypothetical protein
MKGYIINNRADTAIQLAERLPKNERNIVTFLLWANAIAHIGDIQLADRIHMELNTLSSLTRAFFANDRRLINALIDVCNAHKHFFYGLFFDCRWMENVGILIEWKKHLKI